MTFNVKVSGLRCHVSGVKCPVSGVRAQVPGCQVSGVSVKVPPSVDICRRSMNDNFFDNDRTPSPPPPLPPPPPVLAVALAGNGETGMGGAAGAAHEMDAGGGGAGLTRSFWREENGKRRVKRMRRVRRVIYMKDTYNTHTLHTVRHHSVQSQRATERSRPSCGTTESSNNTTRVSDLVRILYRSRTHQKVGEVC